MADGEMAAESFDRLASELRPRLHRYCARMVGSAFDGEDVLQDALTKALEAVRAGAAIERPEAWLFRIAHNTALDALRRSSRRRHVPLNQTEPGPERADTRVAASASLATFMALPPGQRACVILADVLGCSLNEIAETLEISLAAAKASLSRGRSRLQTVATAPEAVAPPSGADLERLRAYADRFNARDFDALRALLAEDVRLDLANRTRLTGRKDVSVYFTRYAGAQDWRFSVGAAEGRPVLLVSDPADPTGRPIYAVVLGWAGEEIVSIRDFRFAPYLIDSLATEIAAAALA